MISPLNLIRPKISQRHDYFDPHNDRLAYQKPLTNVVKNFRSAYSSSLFFPSEVGPLSWISGPLSILSSLNLAAGVKQFRSDKSIRYMYIVIVI